MTSRKLGLVLSGGGTRGIAHIGVLKALSTMPLSFAAIAGCSIGAIVGAGYAAGKSIEDIERFALSQKMVDLFQWPISKLGLTKLEKFEKRYYAFIGASTFEQLKIPLAVNATNLTTGQSVIWRTGPLQPAIRASMAVPGIIAPIKNDDGLYVDGGVLDQHPFSNLPPEVDHFIISNASGIEHLQPSKKINLIDVLRTALNLMENEITDLRLARLAPSQFVMIVPELTGHSVITLGKSFAHLIEHGESATREKSEQILKLIQA